jgi:hypothetical protein
MRYPPGVCAREGLPQIRSNANAMIKDHGTGLVAAILIRNQRSHIMINRAKDFRSWFNATLQAERRGIYTRWLLAKEQA